MSGRRQAETPPGFERRPLKPAIAFNPPRCPRAMNPGYRHSSRQLLGHPPGLPATPIEPSHQSLPPLPSDYRLAYAAVEACSQLQESIPVSPAREFHVYQVKTPRYNPFYPVPRSPSSRRPPPTAAEECPHCRRRHRLDIDLDLLWRSICYFRGRANFPANYCLLGDAFFARASGGDGRLRQLELRADSIPMDDDDDNDASPSSRKSLYGAIGDGRPCPPSVTARKVPVDGQIGVDI